MVNPCFIREYDQLFEPRLCQELIEWFESLEGSGCIYDREQFSGHPRHMKDDNVITLETPEMLRLNDSYTYFGQILDLVWAGYNEYVKTHSILDQIEKVTCPHLWMQRTKPGQGYHVWHFEDDNFTNAGRIMTFVIYLNTVKEGGETELLYYSKRFKPETGKMILFPAGFTHSHRGNPPLSETKYVLTGWIEHCN